MSKDENPEKEKEDKKRNTDLISSHVEWSGSHISSRHCDVVL